VTAQALGAATILVAAILVVPTVKGKQANYTPRQAQRSR
jgi:hypothetical protein